MLGVTGLLRCFSQATAPPSLNQGLQEPTTGRQSELKARQHCLLQRQHPPQIANSISIGQGTPQLQTPFCGTKPGLLLLCHA